MILIILPSGGSRPGLKWRRTQPGGSNAMYRDCESTGGAARKGLRGLLDELGIEPRDGAA